jgi:hypothetical protein
MSYKNYLHQLYPWSFKKEESAQLQPMAVRTIVPSTELNALNFNQKYASRILQTGNMEKFDTYCMNCRMSEEEINQVKHITLQT